MLQKVLVMACAAGVVGTLAGSAFADTQSPDAGDPSKQVKHHKVQTGESLSTIAELEHLDSWRPLWNVNKDLTDPDIITVDQDLVVPDGPTEDRPVPEKPLAAAPATTANVTYSAPVSRHASATNFSEGAGGVLGRVRMRESGGNYATNTGNGYYGAYQFDLGTWRGVGGSGLPSDASPAEQDARAQALYAKRGCSPWPNTCG